MHTSTAGRTPVSVKPRRGHEPAEKLNKIRHDFYSYSRATCQYEAPHRGEPARKHYAPTSRGLTYAPRPLRNCSCQQKRSRALLPYSPIVVGGHRYIVLRHSVENSAASSRIVLISGGVALWNPVINAWTSVRQLTGEADCVADREKQVIKQFATQIPDLACRKP